MRLRSVSRLGLVAGISWALLASVPVAQAPGRGISPGTFTHKPHDAVPLLVKPGFSPFFQRVPDTSKLSGIAPRTQAGAHADTSVTWVLTVSGGAASVLDGTEVPTDVVVKSPPGLLVDFASVPTCSRDDFVHTVVEDPSRSCPVASQVGVVSVLFGGALADRTYPLYKIEPRAGELAAFGYAYELIFERVGVVVSAELRTEEDYGITLARRATGVPEFAPASFMTFWGVPGDSSHDPERWNPATHNWGAPSETPAVPLMTSSSDCNATALAARLQLRYWSEQGRWLPEDPEDIDYRSPSLQPSGCDGLVFAPQVDVSAAVGEVDSPSGVDVRIDLPRNPDPRGLETPPLKEVKLTLPAGMGLNPAAAHGFEGCALDQIGLRGSSFPMPTPIRFDPGPAHCPEASKIGIATVHAPLVEEPVTGEVFLATPYENPLGSLLALYLVLKAQSPLGHTPIFTVKLPVGVAVDPGTGQVTATIDSLPQLPLESIEIKLARGVRAPLVTPAICGKAVSEVQFTPWSAPQSGPPAVLRDEIELNSGPAGGACGHNPETRPFSPTLMVGTMDPAAAASSSLLLHIGRGDGEQELKTISVELPRGVVPGVRGFASCGEAEIERAEARVGVGGAGVAERDKPSCVEGSKVGSVLVGAGAGPTPLLVKGSVYLAGPYKGAPLSLVAIAPAVAGGTEDRPLFDLGTIVERAALAVDPRSARVTAKLEQVPRSLGGIPLRIQEMRFVLDRAGFIRNSSSCEEKRATAEFEGASGAQVTLLNRYQVGECARLRFRPRLRIGLTGASGRGRHAGLRAVLDSRRDGTAIVRSRVTLPSALGLDEGRLRDVCSDAAFARHECPARSLVGRANASSPLLPQPLTGAIYLRPSGGELPSLALRLDGPVSIEAVGEMRLRDDRRVQVTFTGLPDVPLESLTAQVRGGKGGLLINRHDLCVRAVHFGVRITAHNGKAARRRASAAGRCAAGSRSPRGDSQVKTINPGRADVAASG